MPRVAMTRVARFMGGVRELVEARAGRVVVVAGADLAHVGPRFGDARPYERRSEAGSRKSTGNRSSMPPRSTRAASGRTWPPISANAVFAGWRRSGH